MDKNNFEVGLISEQDLVTRYGSQSQKDSYEKLGYMQTKNKQTLLKKVSRYCKIEPHGKKEYMIKEVYPYILPANFSKMNTSLYQYIVPLLLEKIINGHDKNRKIDITLGKWAREINMVNQNYNLCKYNKEETSRAIKYELDTINEFYNKSDDMIEYYIMNALDYLKSAGLIIWRDVYKITSEVSDEMIEIDSDGVVHANIKLETREASKEDMDFYAACIKVADEKANITNASERYYSKKSQRFSEALKDELYKRKIKLVYKSYEAYYIDLDKCSFVLNQFPHQSNIIKKFNDTFTEMIIGNAQKRFDKSPRKYTIYESKDDYSLCFKGLCEMTINNETEYLGKRINKRKVEDEYTLQIN